MDLEILILYSHIMTMMTRTKEIQQHLFNLNIIHLLVLQIKVLK